jgi:hypothetical protein
MRRFLLRKHCACVHPAHVHSPAPTPSYFSFVQVNSPNVEYGTDFVEATYKYESTRIDKDANGGVTITPETTKYQFRTSTKVPKLGYVRYFQN